MIAECFRCHKGYDTLDPDKIAGDGKCPPCEELSKNIAFQVDMKMAEIRKNRPPVKSRLQELGLVDEYGNPTPIKRISASQLGVNFNPD